MLRSLKDTLIVFLPTFATGILSFLTGVWTRNEMEPEVFGLWLTLQLIMLYGAFIQLGITNGIHREIPRLLGQKKEVEAHDLREITHTWLCILLVICLIFSILILFIDIGWRLKVLIALSILTIPIQQFLIFGRILFVTISDFKKVANIQLIFGPVQSLFTIGFVFLWDIYGMFFAVIGANLIGALYAHFSFENKIGFKFDLIISKRLIKFGFPLMLVSFAYLLLISLDRMFISTMLGTKSLGYYSLALLVYQTLIMFPQILEQVSYPKINFEYGKSGNQDSIFKMIVDPSKFIGICFPVFLGSIWVLLPKFVEQFLPDYIVGINAANILLIGIYFLSVVGMYTTYLKIIDKQLIYLSILIGCLVVNGVLDFIFIKLGYGISGISIATSITYSAYAIVILFVSLKYMQTNRKTIIKNITSLFSPLILAAFLLSLIQLGKMGVVFELIIFNLSYIFFIVVLFKQTIFSSIENLNLNKILKLKG
jgi:O-antigen/teichoic acid export membrane protein